MALDEAVLSVDQQTEIDELLPVSVSGRFSFFGALVLEILTSAHRESLLDLSKLFSEKPTFRNEIGPIQSTSINHLQTSMSSSPRWHTR